MRWPSMRSMNPLRCHLALLACGLSLTTNGANRDIAQRATALLARSSSDTGARTFPVAVVQELAALRASTTPAAWRRAHPTDRLVRFERRLVLENDDRWCAMAIERTILADSTPVIRYAYFYPPAAPPSLSLPLAEDSRLIDDQCRLGAIWVETPARDSLAGRALAAQTREALTQVLGPIHPAPNALDTRLLADTSRRAAIFRFLDPDVMRLGLHFFGSAHWHVAGRWQSDSTVAVSAYDKGLSHRAARVLACAFLPFAGVGSFSPVVAEERAADKKVSALATEAAELSGLDRSRVDRLLAVLAAAEGAYTSAPPDSARARARGVDTLLSSGLGDWITASRGLDAPHRAAALLAADQVLGSRPLVFVLAQESGGAARRALSPLGARFVHDELGGGENYAHTWLDEARRLDSAGRTGQLATLALLRLGFNMTGMCGGGEEPSRRVSSVGEQLLRSVLDSGMTAEVHLLVANGYADVVALAAGAGRNYADSAVYATAAPEARRRAIHHYRQGIALDPRSPDAQAEWLEAWRLLAGLPPTTTHFFCVYD